MLTVLPEQGWCAERAPWISESLQPGATDEEIEEVENELEVKFPTALKAIYKSVTNKLVVLCSFHTYYHDAPTGFRMGLWA